MPQPSRFRPQGQGGDPILAPIKDAFCSEPPPPPPTPPPPKKKKEHRFRSTEQLLLRNHILWTSPKNAIAVFDSFESAGVPCKLKVWVQDFPILQVGGNGRKDPLI